MAKAPWHIWLLYAVYGGYYALTEGVAKALVAEIVDENHRGAAFGIYNASIGLLAMPAIYIAGMLWDKASSSAPFYFGAAMAVIGVLLLAALKMKPNG